jgi:hypothetical protein
MTQGQDFSLQRYPSSEVGWHGEKQGTKRVDMALAGYPPRLGKFNSLNKNGLFGKDRYYQVLGSPQQPGKLWC